MEKIKVLTNANHCNNQLCKKISIQLFFFSLPLFFFTPKTVYTVSCNAECNALCNVRYTVCEIIKKDMLFPIFTLRDEKFFFDTVKSSIGEEEDIDFYKDKEFSDRFFLKGDINSLVRRFFNDKLRESFKKYHIKGISYMGKPKALLFCHESFMNLKQRKAVFLDTT